jgi:hypothetical protein
MTTLLTTYYLLILLLCFSVTYSLAVEAGKTTTATYFYDSTILLFMPVTTRSRAKITQDVIQEATKPISPDSASSLLVKTSPNLSSTKQNGVITVSSNTDTPDTLIDVPIATLTNYHHDHPLTNLPPSLVGVSYFEISKFQITSANNFETTLPLSDSLSSTELYHNSDNLKSCTMEADCKDKKLPPTSLGSSPDPMDKIQQLFTALSAQIESQNVIMSQEFQQLVQDNQTFKQEVRAEMEELCQLFTMRHSSNSSKIPGVSTVVPSMANSTSTPAHPVVPPNLSSSVPQGLSSSMTASSSTDMQTQIMYMLTEAFSKLSTVLSDKSSDTKSDWPKFSGDTTKFRSWYLAIIAQLSLPPWQELYDSAKHDIVSYTSNQALNGKLYAKLLLALEGSV